MGEPISSLSGARADHRAANTLGKSKGPNVLYGGRSPAVIFRETGRDALTLSTRNWQDSVWIACCTKEPVPNETIVTITANKVAGSRAIVGRSFKASRRPWLASLKQLVSIRWRIGGFSVSCPSLAKYFHFACPMISVNTKLNIVRRRVAIKAIKVLKLIALPQSGMRRPL